MLNRPATDVFAVTDLTFDATSGEVLGIMGPNGAGKTTLVKMLCTLLLPSSGSGCIQGYDLVDEAAAVRGSISFVTGEERSFYWRLTGRQNLRFFAGLLGLCSERSAAKINELAQAFGLEELLDKRFDTYSTGNRQKLAIVRGLLNEASVLFLDEPTRSLDPNSSSALMKLLRDNLAREQGKTIVLVTHRLDEAINTCDRLLIMNRGKSVFLGPPGQLVSGGLDSGWVITCRRARTAAKGPEDAAGSLASLAGVTFSVYHAASPNTDAAAAETMRYNLLIEASADVEIGDVIARLHTDGFRTVRVEPSASAGAAAFALLTGEEPEQ